jgi:hypothetical protein
VGTVLQDEQQRPPESQPRWDRLARADLCAPYREWRTQGISERQAATESKVPRTPLPAWRLGHATLDSCPQGAECLPSGPGLAWFHRLVMGFHLVGVAGGACGMCLVGLLLPLPGLDRFGAASYGAQPPGNRRGAAVRVAERQDDTARWAQDRPRKDLTLTQDATWTGGRGLVTMEPERHGMIGAQRAQAREQGMWQALLAPALEPRNGQGLQATSDEAPGLLAYGAPALEAHHAPDGFHGQHERSQAVSAPLAPPERAAPQAATEARAPLEQVQARRPSGGDEPAQRGLGRPPKQPVRLGHAEPVRDVASRAHARLAQHRAQGANSLRAIGHASQCGALARGVRRNGQRMAADIPGRIAQGRAMAQHAGRSQRGLERIAQAERVVPHRQATRACVSGYGGPQGEPLAWTPAAACAMPAQRSPSFDLDRVAPTRPGSDGEPLRGRAERLRPPLLAPGGALSALSPEAQDPLPNEAQRLAPVFQRSRAHVEGRNGSWSRRHHQRRGLDLPRQRECCTAMHTLVRTRPDGPTAAERFVGQQPRSLWAALWASVELAPTPLKPPRRA